MADIIDRLITRIEFVGVATAITSMRDFARAFQALQGPGITNWNRLAAGLSAVAAPLGFIAGVAALQAAAGIVKVSVAFDGLQRKLEVLYGSSSKAQKAFQWIVDFAGQTSFTVEETVEAFIRMGNLNMSPTRKNLQIIAGYALLTKKSFEDTAKAIGFGSLGNFTRLRAFGISREQVARNAAPGVIPLTGRITNGPAAAEAILKTLEKKGLASFNSFQQSPGTAISNFQDAIQRLAYTLAGGRTAAEGVVNAFTALKSIVDLVTGTFLTVRGLLEVAFFSLVNGVDLFVKAIDMLIQKSPDWLIGKPIKNLSTTFRTFMDAFSGTSMRNVGETMRQIARLRSGIKGEPPKIPGTDINYGETGGGISAIIKTILGGGFISKIGVNPSELPGLQRDFNNNAPKTVRIEGSEGSPLYKAMEDIVNKVNYQAFRTQPGG